MASSTRHNDAGANRCATVVDGLLGDFSSAAKAARGKGAADLAEPQSELAGIITKDYGQALRKCLSRWEVREIAQEGKTHVWPQLNRAPVALVSPHEFARRWSGFGVDFKFASLRWKTGLSLLGFYVDKIDRVRTRPLIFVNTAHHPAVVGVALDHEMGHHLTSQIFAAEKHAHLLSRTGFDEHLTEQSELAADTLVSLAMLPAPIARVLFGDANRIGSRGRANQLSRGELAKVFEYVDRGYGLRVDQIRGRLQTLAGLVHYTKLRRALLDEYNT